MNLEQLEAIFWGDQREQPARVRLARVVRALQDYLPRSLSEVAVKECCGNGVQTYGPPECCGIPNLMVTTDQVHDAFNNILGEQKNEEEAPHR